MKKILLLLFIALSGRLIAEAQNNVINQTGPVGIGTTTPIAGSWLHVYRSATGNYNPLIMLQDGLAGGFTQLGLKATARTFHIGVGNSGAAFGLSNKFFIWDQNASLPRLVIDLNGSVGIGTTNIDNNYKLFVEGAIRTRKIRIDQGTWPDYVFANNYYLPSLPELAAFIRQNNHLPGVPSADEVKEKGVDVGDMQEILLKKIEELSLYIIKQNERIEELQKKVNDLESRASDQEGNQ